MYLYVTNFTTTHGLKSYENLFNDLLTPLTRIFNVMILSLTTKTESKGNLLFTLKIG